MDNEKVKRNREYAERAFWTGHYHFLMQALAVASTHCLVWRSVGEGLPFTLKDIFELAKRHDEEHEISEPSFYLSVLDLSISHNGCSYLWSRAKSVTPY